MRLTFIVTAEVEHIEGKFAPRDELAEEFIGELEGADPGSMEGGEGGQYEVTDFSVEEEVVERGRELMQVTAAERRMIEKARAARRKGKG